MIRSIFLALALLLPVSWTVARAGRAAPADGAKKEKKAKKGKKAERRPRARRKPTRRSSRFYLVDSGRPVRSPRRLELRGLFSFIR